MRILPGPMLWLRAAQAALALFGASACMRTAGTEVGNPTVVVSASFSVLQPWEEEYMRTFSLRVLCVQYATASAREGELWASPDGNMVNWLAGGEESRLPAVKAEGDWIWAEMSVSSPGGGETWSEGMDLGDITSGRYVKGMYGDSLPDFLFELPEDMHYKLRFESERISGWLDGDSLNLSVSFDCGKWLKGMDFSGADRRRDAAGREFVMLSPDENADLHAELLRRFPECFNADAYRQGDTPP